jgi:hypothetical protein
MRMTGLCLVLGISLLPLASAYGASRDAKERAAKKACMTGDPTKGVEILADLYIDTNEPTYIFNQGRCLEQNHKCEDAIERFREYQRKVGDDAVEAKTEAQKHIRECQAVLGIKASDQPASPGAGLASTSPGQPTSNLEQPPAGELVATPSPRRDLGAGLRTTGIVTASVGAVGVLAGLVFNLKYNSGVGDIEAKYQKSHQSSNEDNKTLAIVGYGVGAACLVGGAILYYVGWRQGKVVATPGTIAGSPGAVIGGAF